MPPKKKSTAQQPAMQQQCDICCQSIAENDKQGGALFCQGECQRWIHRFCASVSLEQFKSLVSSEAPFLCPTCCRKSHQHQISELTNSLAALKSELAQLKDAFATVTAECSTKASAVDNLALRSEISELKEAFSLRSAEEEATGHTVASASYASKAATGAAGSTQWKTVGRRGKQSTTRSVPENRNSVKQFSKPASVPRPERFVGPRARIDGVRHVWGTMKSSTSSTVSTALNRLTTLGSKLLVKRKYKSLENGKTKWWFLVKGDESALMALESEWEKMEIQTSWKLEPCFLPVANEDPTEDPPIVQQLPDHSEQQCPSEPQASVQQSTSSGKQPPPVSQSTPNMPLSDSTSEQIPFLEDK